MSAALAVAGPPGFTPTAPLAANHGAIAKDSAGPATRLDQRPDTGRQSTTPSANSSDVRPALVSDEPHAPGLPYRNTAPEAAPSSGVISDLAEFYTEYEAVQLDRQQKLGRQPITVPDAPTVRPYTAPEPGIRDTPTGDASSPTEAPINRPDLQPADSLESPAPEQFVPDANRNEAGTDQQNQNPVDDSPRQGQ